MVRRHAFAPATIAALAASFLAAAFAAGAAPAAPAGWETTLFLRLEAGDRLWLPRRLRGADGRDRYVYRRRLGDPPLSLEQIHALLRNPPRYERERSSIRANLALLRRLGVRVELHPPRVAAASGEWDPQRARLRIRPDVPSAGSRVFATVLNHEVIHVAQSCRGGGVRRPAQLLGLPRRLGEEERQLLASPAYRQADARVRWLEEEAFANQHDLELGTSVLRRHCPLAAGAPPARLGR
jgi:hypothetical protein